MIKVCMQFFFSGYGYGSGAVPVHSSPLTSHETHAPDSATNFVRRKQRRNRTTFTLQQVWGNS